MPGGARGWGVMPRGGVCQEKHASCPYAFGFPAAGDRVIQSAASGARNSETRPGRRLGSAWPRRGCPARGGPGPGALGRSATGW